MAGKCFKCSIEIDYIHLPFVGLGLRLLGTHGGGLNGDATIVGRVELVMALFRKFRAYSAGVTELPGPEVSA